MIGFLYSLPLRACKIFVSIAHEAVHKYIIYFLPHLCAKIIIANLYLFIRRERICIVTNYCSTFAVNEEMSEYKKYLDP